MNGNTNIFDGNPYNIKGVSEKTRSKERMEMAASIVSDDITFCYGDLTAVDHASFEVEQGEVLGFLGPNGGGKTTTLTHKYAWEFVVVVDNDNNVGHNRRSILASFPNLIGHT